ncbi:MarR family transcriptional regulator [Streptomyces sp. F001]|uniref:MarR family winged helix-turn-helix transcriptional regulator n=1 Tax=Streptomyces sp. F001 TaxID=1510026 RepID=UPI00101E31D1|nr:MarR family transcriptional regulator [Streptomyces sp. F001]RZB19692.1 MarR family transcriptional regulator [Streptomyces sp. F001]
MNAELADTLETDPLDRLGFLLARHGAIANSRMEHAFALCGLTPRQGVTLILLGRSGNMSQQGVAGALEVDPSVLCGILNDLESTQFVERRRDPADRRRHIVVITEEGSRVLAKAQEAIEKVERELFADLTAEELGTLRDLLSRVRTSKGDIPCTER